MSKEGEEIAKALFRKFGGPLAASKAVGLNESTLEKWRTGERSPRRGNYRKCLAVLQDDDIQSREARILNYQKQISESGRILWNDQDQQ